MRTLNPFLSSAFVALLVTGCKTIDTTSPAAASDTTPPTIGIVVTGEEWYDGNNDGMPEAHPFTLSTRDRRGNEAIVPLPEGKGTFRRDIRNLSVIMTAQDPESGIRRIKLMVNRDVCFKQPGATDWSSPFYDHNGTFSYDGQLAERDSESRFSDPRKLPAAPTLTHSLSPAHLLHVILSPGVEREGQGGVFTFYGEAENGSVSGTVYMLPLVLSFGELGCIGSP